MTLMFHTKQLVFSTDGLALCDTLAGNMQNNHNKGNPCFLPKATEEQNIERNHVELFLFAMRKIRHLKKFPSLKFLLSSWKIIRFITARLCLLVSHSA